MTNIAFAILNIHVTVTYLRFKKSLFYMVKQEFKKLDFSIPFILAYKM